MSGWLPVRRNIDLTPENTPSIEAGADTSACTKRMPGRRGTAGQGDSRHAIAGQDRDQFVADGAPLLALRLSMLRELTILLHCGASP